VPEEATSTSGPHGGVQLDPKKIRFLPFATKSRYGLQLSLFTSVLLRFGLLVDFAFLCRTHWSP
jgi:hypothetical protein